MESVLQKLLPFEVDEQEESAVCQWFAKKVQLSMDAAREAAAKDSQDLQDELSRWIRWAHRPAGTDGESVALLSNLEVPVMIVRLKELKGTMVPTERSTKVSCGYA